MRLGWQAVICRFVLLGPPHSVVDVGWHTHRGEVQHLLQRIAAAWFFGTMSFTQRTANQLP